MSAPKVLVIFGTRPEAIKLFPVIQALTAHGGLIVRTCVTAQHRGLLDQVLGIAGIVPDVDLDVMTPGQSLDQLTARLLTGLGEVLDAERPARVLVQGDTATAMVGALAAYYRKVPVGHVEAGLRSGDIYQPWPEEVNRRIVAPIADQHFAPTETAALALRRENIDPATIHVTGNTVIDALLAEVERQRSPAVQAQIRTSLARELGPGALARPFVLVTGHRRENFGQGFEGICTALAGLAARFPEHDFIYPVHLNPNVREPVRQRLSGISNIRLIAPQPYREFVALMDACRLVLTDSGGVQEEAPSLGKPVLVMRDTTERPEGVSAGTVRLVGADPERLVHEVSRLLTDRTAYEAMALAANPYGDGKAAPRVVDELRRYLAA
jgi:UDP-N-acetylglucosamine 2-epimerase (non-hydrolysing)